MARTSHTIFLAKAVFPDFADYLSEKARERVGGPNHQVVEVRDLGIRSSLHVFKGFAGPPPWMTKLRQRVPELELLNRQSIAGLLFVLTDEHVVVFSFAHGWMLLNDRRFESDFGLRVAVNALDPDAVRSLERANLGDALQGVSQSPFQRGFETFGVEDALDLVKKLSGAASDESGLDTLTGARSLKITGDFTIDEVVAFSGQLIELYNSLAYRQTPFRIMDSVRLVSDAGLIDQLFMRVVESFRARQDNFEFSLPGTAEAEGVSFKFSGPGLRRTFPDLLVSHYIQAMGGRIEGINIETLSDHKIVAEFDDDRPPRQTSLRNAVLGSTVLDGTRYAVNDGRWYEIDQGFKDSVEANFLEAIAEWEGAPPPPIRKIFDENGNGRIEREEAYNERLADDLGLILLDKTEVTVPGVPRSGFEPCDLLDFQNRRFIHVKKSSRRSNILSHFFKQGSNSAQQFKKVSATWGALANVVRERGFEAAAGFLEDEMNRAGRGWTVEFWIVDAPRRDGRFNIPFFSKISLRDETADLRAMEYSVAVKFIALPPERV